MNSVIPQLVLWRCGCGQLNRSRFPSEKDVLRLNGNRNVWSLSQDDVLRTQASTIEVVGNRKCKHCGTEQAIVVYSESGWECQAFAYNTDSTVGKRVQTLLKVKEKK